MKNLQLDFPYAFNHLSRLTVAPETPIRIFKLTQMKQLNRAGKGEFAKSVALSYKDSVCSYKISTEQCDISCIAQNTLETKMG